MLQDNEGFLNWYNSFSKEAQINNERRLVILSGQENWAFSLLNRIELVTNTLSYTLQRSNTEHKPNCIIYGDSALFPANISHNRFRDRLGTESELIVFADSKFSIDAFAALSGTLKAGGVLFIVVSSLTDKIAESLFFNRFYSIVKSFPAHQVISQSQEETTQESRSTFNVLLQQDTSNLDNTSKVITADTRDIASSNVRLNDCITPEQCEAVDKVIKVVTGHRKRPFVLTADRGRGKSSALAIACAQLMKKYENSNVTFVITAPDLQCLNVFYQQLITSLQPKDLPKEQYCDGHIKPLYSKAEGHIVFGQCTLSFIPIDQLIKEPVKCQLLMVDEAAAIPVYLLSQLLSHYHRMVFSSTVHGYEGAGRGFTLKFQKILDRLCPQWTKLHIKQPIRWRENDPLEQLVFESCLLNAELPKIEASRLNNAGAEQENQNSKGIFNKLKYKAFSAKELLEQEYVLKQVFAVLVTAHYQTKPSDLLMLLDKKQLQLVCLYITVNNKINIVAVSLLMTEGAGVYVDNESVLAVKQSKRRLRDHFLPQSLLTHCGFESAFSYSYTRILRIAVHPELQQQGIGSYFIQKITMFAKELGHDFIGSSFGANHDLQSFWLDANFSTVRVGFTKDKASGEHSALVLAGLNNEALAQVEYLSREFYRCFDYLLLDEYQSLAPELILLLLKNNLATELLPLSDLDRANVQAYVNGERLFSSCVYSLYLWFKRDLLCKRQNVATGNNKHQTTDKQSQTSINMELVLLARLIQKHDIKAVCQQFSFTGKKALNESMKRYVKSRLPIS